MADFELAGRATITDGVSPVLQKMIEQFKAQGASTQEMTTAFKGLGFAAREVEAALGSGAGSGSGVTPAVGQLTGALDMNYRTGRLLAMTMASELTPAIGSMGARMGS